MSLRPAGHVDLPAHRKPGGFDHAAIHAPSGRLLVAPTANSEVDVVDVVDTDSLARLQSVPTERGAKTTALDAERNRLFVFCPATHRAAIFEDS